MEKYVTIMSTAVENDEPRHHRLDLQETGFFFFSLDEAAEISIDAHLCLVVRILFIFF